MKTVVFTHNDLDGVACGIIALHYFPDANVHYCSYQNIESVIQMFLALHSNDGEPVVRELENYRIIISDISFKQNSEIAHIIQKCKFGSLIIADHHKTSLWMNHYPFNARQVFRSIESDGDYSAALLLDLLLYDTHLNNVINDETFIQQVPYVFRMFSEHVSSWDTWEWTKNLAPNSENAIDVMKHNRSYFLNTLMNTVGIPVFVSRITMGLQAYKDWCGITDIYEFICYLFTEEELSTTASVIDKVFDLMSNITIQDKVLHTTAYGNIKFGFVALQEYSQTSIASEYIKQTGMMNKDAKFLAMVSGDNPKGVSLRLPAKDIDLSVIATEFGGGGHINAAGCDYGEFTGNILSNSDEEK